MPRVIPAPRVDISNPRTCGPPLNTSDAYTGISPMLVGVIKRSGATGMSVNPKMGLLAHRYLPAWTISEYADLGSTARRSRGGVFTANPARVPSRIHTPAIAVDQPGPITAMSTPVVTGTNNLVELSAKLNRAKALTNFWRGTTVEAIELSAGPYRVPIAPFTMEKVKINQV